MNVVAEREVNVTTVRQSVTRLHAMLAASAVLHAIDAVRVDERPNPDKWSLKEELGHLIDAATNCHLRLIRAQLETNPEVDGAYGPIWVDLHVYTRREWEEMVDVWRCANLQVIWIADAIPDAGWSRRLTLNTQGTITLGDMMHGYIRHVQHHLEKLGVKMEMKRR